MQLSLLTLLLQLAIQQAPVLSLPLAQQLQSCGLLLPTPVADDCHTLLLAC